MGNAQRRGLSLQVSSRRADAAIKAKGKRQKAKGKSTEKSSPLPTFAFCLLPFALCLERSDAVSVHVGGAPSSPLCGRW
jgi:hypothetical protein